MLRMSPMKDLRACPQPLVGASGTLETQEDHLAIQAGHSVHLRVFPKDLVVSQVVIQSEASRLVIRMAAFPAAIPLEVFLVGIPLVAVSLVVAEAAEAAGKSQDKLP